jgi:phosphoribosylcarboxyaminoimidazole (NCAIR) mutase
VVLDPGGAALLAAKILSLGDGGLRERVAQAQQAATAQIESDDESLKQA